MNGIISVTLTEWDECSPDKMPVLAGLSFGDDNAARAMAEQLAQSGMLQVDELLRGIRIRSRSFVGTVQLGRLGITVRPKLCGSVLSRLLRYAYGLRDLRLLPEAENALDKGGFQDLLIYQLLAEAHELAARGLHKHYQRVEQHLSSPRGRINFREYVLGAGSASATLPCVHHPRTEDCLHNQVLLGGLHLARHLAKDIELRSRVHRLSSVLEMGISPVHPDDEVLKRLDRQLNRLTIAYQPAIELIRLLATSYGTLLDPKQPTSRLPGFLFDMNRFFQALLSRFLWENLDGYIVREEAGVREMMRYIPGYELDNHRAPSLRPDLMVLKGGQVVALLDVKYRDLWEKGLPQDMLYQLAIYALSQGLGSAVILYPSVEPKAKEARIEVSSPLGGSARAIVIMRPVNLEELDRLISQGNDRERRQLARKLALGAEGMG